MARKPSFSPDVPALSLSEACWGVITAASSPGTAINFATALSTKANAARDVSNVKQFILEVSNGRNTTGVTITIGTNTAAIPIPAGQTLRLVVDGSDTVRVIGANSEVVTAIAYVYAL